MKFLKRVVPALFGLALLSAACIAGYFALKSLAGVLGAAEIQAHATTLLLPAALLLAAHIVGRSVRAASRPGEASQLCAQRAATYQLSVGLWEDLLQGRAEPGEDLQAVDRLLALYGSPRVIKAHTTLRAAGRARKPEAKALFAAAVMEMRKDLGSETQGLSAEELSTLLLAAREAADAPVGAAAYQDLRPRVSLAPNL
ncbi:MAG TPA: hypothetical protein VGX48_11740 [Pyrinomonadaceae bacterium]|nr:hypothetical protein [Pyrinomonadaceae bacterium]